MVLTKMQVWLVCLALVGLVLLNQECVADLSTDNANPGGGSGGDASNAAVMATGPGKVKETDNANPAGGSGGDVANPAVMGKSAVGTGKVKGTDNANPGGASGGDAVKPAVMGKSTTGPGKQTVSDASLVLTPSGEHHAETETYDWDP